MEKGNREREQKEEIGKKKEKKNSEEDWRRRTKKKTTDHVSEPRSNAIKSSETQPKTQWLARPMWTDEKGKKDKTTCKKERQKRTHDHVSEPWSSVMKMNHPEHNGLLGQCEWTRQKGKRKKKKEKKKKLTDLLADRGHKAQADLKD